VKGGCGAIAADARTRAQARRKVRSLYRASPLILHVLRTLAAPLPAAA
jgi:hypothetical protein